ncbi:hypothetical protein HA50_24330 [Pantoea cypripedii]|uniref:Uncharacterized protein n=1 Tax=Pantoea cypripedii TaxID=55209 RepID=A0A1X1ELM1_PANCY|nr:hypothetical protein HA50_24330 [Pantoea cypripedii]
MMKRFIKNSCIQLVVAKELFINRARFLVVKNQIVIFSGVKNDGDIDTFDDDIGGEMTSGCVEV